MFARSPETPTSRVQDLELRDSNKFIELYAQFELYEGKITNLLEVVSIQCEACEKIQANCLQLQANLPSLLPQMQLEQHTFNWIAHANTSMATFRDTLLAPFQKLKSSFSQLKLQLDHRRGALETAQRYERKVLELQQKLRLGNRLRRNRFKLAAAKQRFHELDQQSVKELEQLLSQYSETTFVPPLSKFFLAQQEWARHLENSFQHFANTLEPQEAIADDNDEQTPEIEAGVGTEKVSTPPQSLLLTEPDEHHARLDQLHEELKDSKVPLNVSIILDKRRSLRPKQKHVTGTRMHTIHSHVRASMTNGFDLRQCVKLPFGFEKEEWIGVHVIDFFNELNVLYGTISELCTSITCPTMGAGPCYTYLWADGVKITSPIAVSAPQYVEYLMEWVEMQLKDVDIFPPEGTKASAKFTTTSRTILKRMFRVYAHMYHSHLDHFINLHAESHLNFCFKRFIAFVLEFELVQPKELNALRKLIDAILRPT